MADKFRVLIVDDHQEIRTALRANLEALEVDLDLDLVDVPSGEEAIVEVVGTGIDLLIADIGLPGLSGIELYKKLKYTFPDMQVILITGLEEEDIHQEIADVGAEAFFLKPLKMPELLNAVRRAMGLDPVENAPETLQRLTKQNLDDFVTERIADLRGELGAISILVIEKTGVISAETGIVPDTIYESHVMPLLLQTFSLTNKISSFLGKDNPESVWYFSGEKYDLFWSHIDAEYGMMVITNPVTQNNDLSWVLTTLDLAIQEVTQIIHNLKGTPAVKTKSSAKDTKADKVKSKAPVKAELPQEKKQRANGSAKTKAKSAPKKVDKDAEEESEIDNADENEVHEFWKAATLETEIQRIDSPDSLSFEQAQKLGFVPGGDNINS
ncbi:MAG: response regulator [Anaerolineales bacterium]|nr:response regulator [Anaerolineales bacterium]